MSEQAAHWFSTVRQPVTLFESTRTESPLRSRIRIHRLYGQQRAAVLLKSMRSFHNFVFCYVIIADNSTVNLANDSRPKGGTGRSLVITINIEQCQIISVAVPVSSFLCFMSFHTVSVPFLGCTVFCLLNRCLCIIAPESTIFRVPQGQATF